MPTEAEKKRILNRPNELLIPRNDLAIEKSYQVEIPLNNTTAGAKNKFVLNEILNPKATGSVLFTAAEAMTVDLQTKSETGRPVVSSADAAKIAVVLAWGSSEDIYLFPYTSLISVVNYGMIRRLKNIKISLTNSYIQILDDAVPIAAGKSAVINFMYREPK